MTNPPTRDEEPITAPRGRGDFPALDGLRIVAVTAVVATHSAFSTGRYSTGTGRDVLAHLDIGVAIFFVISGFLISREWLRPDRRTGGLPALRPYLWRRALRILPMYWLTVVIALVVLDANHDRGVGEWLRHLFLVQAYGGRPLAEGLTQTWSLCTEVAFYLALPGLAWLVLRLAGTRDQVATVAAVAAVVLAVAGVGWVAWYHAKAWPTLDSAGYWLPTGLAWFMAGMWLAAVRLGRDEHGSGAARWAALDRLGDSPGVCLLVAGCAFAAAITPMTGAILDPFPTAGQAAVKSVLYGITGLALVLPAVLGRGTGYDAVLGHPAMRYLGRISYSIFLIHLMVLQGVLNVRGQALFTGDLLTTFALTWLVSVPLAAAAYHLVERPALRLRRRVPGYRVDRTRAPATP